jgi:hypothetical protein
VLTTLKALWPARSEVKEGLYVVNASAEALKRVNLYFMGRRWLGVSKLNYLRMPHAESRPESLWWYSRKPRPSWADWADDEPTADAQKVIDTYLERYARGAKVPDGLREDLMRWLQDLSRIHNLEKWGKPRTDLYWTIPNYARALKLNRFTLMKRLRELEKTAKQLFPERAAARGRSRAAVSEKEIEDIRKKFSDGVRVKTIATEFRLPEGHVGLICKAERIKKRTASETEQASAEVAPITDFVSKEPF